MKVARYVEAFHGIKEKPKLHALETVRAAFRAAGLADGGIESFGNVGAELLWQIAEIRAKTAHTEAEVQEIFNAAQQAFNPTNYGYHQRDFGDVVRRILGVPAP